MPTHRLTAQLSLLSLVTTRIRTLPLSLFTPAPLPMTLPLSSPGQQCPAAASAPRSALAHQTTSLMRMAPWCARTQAHHLSIWKGGTCSSRSAGPPEHPTLLVWMYNIIGYNFTSSPRKPSPRARLRRTIPVQSRREHRMRPPQEPDASTTPVGQQTPCLFLQPRAHADTMIMQRVIFLSLPILQF